MSERKVEAQNGAFKSTSKARPRDLQVCTALYRVSRLLTCSITGRNLRPAHLSHRAPLAPLAPADAGTYALMPYTILRKAEGAAGVGGVLTGLQKLDLGG